MILSRRSFLKWLGLGGAALTLGLKPSRSLRLLTTSRGLRAETAAAFMRATNVDIIAVVAPDPQTLAGFDLAIIPAQTLAGFIGRGEVVTLDDLPLPGSLEQRAYDPRNAFSRPAARGVIGINARGVPPPRSWAEFFALARTVPAHLPPAESFRAALRLQNESINTRKAVARNAARALLAGLQSAPAPRAQLAVGAQLDGWDFVVPTEGVEQWEDCYCLPAGSAQVDLARAFIQYALAAQPLAPLPAVAREFASPFAPPFDS